MAIRGNEQTNKHYENGEDAESYKGIPLSRLTGIQIILGSNPDPYSLM